ncbi:4'-phosphopantetheinyl transferase superfamily protein [Flavobacterium sp. LB2R40]|uniref:4'-phosphopantetheinyl transferase family protein n=1 Tax=unclassified Flavobacterium TaxID=196869 RepID=UPI003AAD61E8
MIGNDIIDLALAKKESNWRRKGYLDKIFTPTEQWLILGSSKPDTMVWNLWSRKEAAYKIYNRETGIRGYFPLQLECFYESQTIGSVSIQGKTYFTKTKISNTKIHTIAVANPVYFDEITTLNTRVKISKINGIPFILDQTTKKIKPVSISHHGKLWVGITLLDQNFRYNNLLNPQS